MSEMARQIINYAVCESRNTAFLAAIEICEGVAKSGGDAQQCARMIRDVMEMMKASRPSIAIAGSQQ